MSSQEKNIVNTLYHSAVVSSLMIGYAQIGKSLLKGASPKLSLTLYDAGMVVADLTLAMITKDMLIKQGIIPADITN